MSSINKKSTKIIQSPKIEESFLFDNVADALFQMLKYLISLDNTIIIDNIDFPTILHPIKYSHTLPILITPENKLTIYHTIELKEHKISPNSLLTFIKINKEYEYIQKCLTNSKDRACLNIYIFSNKQVISNIDINITHNLNEITKYKDQITNSNSSDERDNIFTNMAKHNEYIKTLEKAKELTITNIKKDEDIFKQCDLEIKRCNEKKIQLKTFFTTKPTTDENEPLAKKVKTVLDG